MSEHDVVHAELRSIRDDVSEIKGAVARVAEALERLARLEERQATASAALERAFGAIAKMETRLRGLEQAQPVQQMTSDWVGKGVWAALGAAGLFVLKKLGVV